MTNNNKSLELESKQFGAAFVKFMESTMRKNGGTIGDEAVFVTECVTQWVQARISLGHRESYLSKMYRQMQDEVRVDGAEMH